MLMKPSGIPAELLRILPGNVNTAVNVEPAQSGLINEVINSENSKVNDKKADKKKKEKKMKTKKQKSDSESDSDSSESDPETSKSNTNTSTLPSGSSSCY